MATASDEYIFYYAADYIQEGYYEQELYFEGDYLEPGYFEGEQVVAEAVAVLGSAANLQVQTTLFVPVTADLQSTATQTTTETRIKQLDADFDALFSPNVQVSVRKNTVAILDAVASMETDADLIADIDDLLEFFSNLNAQNDRLRLNSAAPSSDFDFSATASATRSTTQTLDSNTTLDSTLDRFRRSSADLFSSADLTPEPTRIQQGIIETDSVATALTAAGKVGQGLVTLEAFSTLDAVTEKRTGIEVEFDADFTQTVTESRLRDNTITLSSNAEFTLTAERTRLSDATFSSSLTLDFTSTVLKELDAALSAVTDIQIQAETTRSALIAAAATVEFAVSSTVTKTLESDLDSDFALTVNEVRNRDSEASVTAESELTSEVSRIRLFESLPITNTMLEVELERIRNNQANVNSDFDLSCFISRTLAATIETDSIATALAVAAINATGTVLLESVSQAAITPLRIFQGSFEQVGSIKTSDSAWALYSASDLYNKDTNQTTNRPAFTQGWAMSFWFKRTNKLEETHFIRTFRTRETGSVTDDLDVYYTPLQSLSEGVFTVRTEESYGFADPDTAATFNWTTALPDNTDWHHYLVGVTQWDADNTQQMQLWIDGVDQGTVATSQTLLHNPSALWDPIELGFQSNGNIAQIWIGRYAEGEAPYSFAVSDFYQDDYKYLGENGELVTGEEPLVYVLGDSPFDSAISSTDNNISSITGNEAFGANAAISSLSVESEGVTTAETKLKAETELTSDSGRVRFGEAVVNSQITSTVNAVKTADITADLTSVSDITADVNNLKGITETELSSSFAISIGVDVTTGGFLLLASNTELAADITVNAFATAELSSEFEIQELGGKLESAEAALTAESDIFIATGNIIVAEITANSQASIQIDNKRIRNYSILLNTAAELETDYLSVRFGEIDLDVQSEINTTATRIFNLSVNLEVTGFVLQEGRVIHIDDFRTLIVPQETRLLLVPYEDRTIQVTEETRKLTVWQQ